jgi:hypothetical protein
MEATLKILAELETTGIISRYAIGGAMGAIFYIEPFLTYDLDIFVVLPQTPSGLLTLTPIYDELRRRGYQAEAECVLVEGVPVQFLPAYNPLLEEALVEAQLLPYGELQTRVIRPEHLVAIMVQTGRHKDRQRFSMFMEQATMDAGYLQEVLLKYQLNERFNKWKTEI